MQNSYRWYLINRTHGRYWRTHFVFPVCWKYLYYFQWISACFCSDSAHVGVSVQTHTEVYNTLPQCDTIRHQILSFSSVWSWLLFLCFLPLWWWRWIKDTHSLCKVRLKSCMLCKVRLMLWPTTSICFPAVNLHARSDIRFVHRCRSATWCVRAGRWRSLAVSEIYGGDVFFVFSLGVTFWCPIRHILWCSR